MISLSHTTGYAILALSCLVGREGRRAFAKDISSHTDIPLPYLAKILNALGRAGITRSRRGYQGGVSLVRSPDKISLWDVAVAVEGEEFLTGVFHRA